MEILSWREGLMKIERRWESFEDACRAVEEGWDWNEDLTDDICRALDVNGWMIVAQPGGVADGSKWPMDGSEGYVPEWAEDQNPPAPVVRLAPRQKVRRRRA